MTDNKMPKPLTTVAKALGYSLLFKTLPACEDF